MEVLLVGCRTYHVRGLGNIPGILYSGALMISATVGAFLGTAIRGTLKPRPSMYLVPIKTSKLFQTSRSFARSFSSSVKVREVLTRLRRCVRTYLERSKDTRKEASNKKILHSPLARGIFGYGIYEFTHRHSK